MGKKTDSTKRPNKVVALITYIIALIALLLGLFLPWGPFPAAEGAGVMDASWAFQLPDALSRAVPVEALVNLIKPEGTLIEGASPFAYSLIITLNGVIEGGYDLGALFTVLYALVVLAGLIALIPAIVSTASKKSKTNVALNAASFIEVLAFLFVACFVLVQLTNFTILAELNNAAPEGTTIETNYQWSYPLLGAFGGTFLMMVIQSIFYKKGSGVFKFVLLLLSTLALMFAVYNVGAVIPQLDAPLSELIGKTEGLFDGKLYNLNSASMIGIIPVYMLFCGGAEGSLFPTLTATLEGMTAIEQTLFLCALILALLAIINFLLDAMGLCKTTKRYMLVSNIIRYVLEFVAAGLVIALPFFMKNDAGDPIAVTGLMSLVIAVLVLVALILNIIRLVRFDKKNKKAKTAKTATVATGATAGAVAKRGPVAAAEEVPAAAKEDAPYVYTPPVYATKEEKKTDGEPEVYSPVLYNGPTDDFINTLSNEQKIEFSRVFLERQNGNLSFISDYVVSGKNEKFFNNIFIYFARLRSIVSNGLLNKMYEYCNLM